MRHLIPLLCAFMISAGQAGEDAAPIVRCPVQTHVLRDGGSILIEIPASGKLPALTIVQDYGGNTKTRGEYFRFDDFRSDGAKPMTARDVLAAFDQAQAVLVARYGKDFLLEIGMNPLSLGKNVTEEEYVRRLPDAAFMERMDLSEILVRIQEYRLHHRPVEDASSKEPR